MIIDVHAHYYSDTFLSLFRATEGNGRDSNWSASALWHLSLAERVELMDNIGVDCQILSVGLAQPYSPDVNRATRLARVANDMYAEACQRFRPRFAALAALPLPHVDAALSELVRCLDVLGMVGVTLGCSVLGRQLDDPLLAPIYEELDQRHCTVLLHPMMQSHAAELDAFELERTVGAVMEDTVAAARLVMSGVVSEYPNIRFIVPHLGGTLPFIVMDRLSRARPPGKEYQKGSWASDGLPGGSPATGFSRLWYDTAVGHVPALRCACETFGADRLVFGTDFPFLSQESLVRRVGDVSAYLGEGSEDTTQLMSGTALELFGLAQLNSP
jgi:6-methylsalicylate decarboxylase